MTWKDAAESVLRDNEYPMRAEIILKTILSKKLISTTGKTPLNTLKTEIYRSCVGHENVIGHMDESIFYEDEDEDEKGAYGLCSWRENNYEVKPTNDLVFPQNKDIVNNIVRGQKYL
jgi:hypothetical protein